MSTLKCILCTLAGFIVATMLFGCGDNNLGVINGKNGKNGAAGSNGSNGTPGSNGNNGTDGINAVIQIIALSSCTNGGYTLLTAQDTNPNGFPDALDSNFQSTEICNGLDGSNGIDGTDGTNGVDGVSYPPLQLTQLVDPCGPSGAHDEVLVKVQDGVNVRLLASFSNNISGDYTRFSVLNVGTNYQTTDTDNCFFDVLADGTLANEHH